MTRTLPAIALAASLVAHPATSATVAFDQAGPFLAVASDAYAGGKVSATLTRGAEIDIELLTLLAFTALVLALWGDDPRHDCRCGVVSRQHDPLAPVPLPGALGGMLAGLGAIGALGRVRRETNQ